MTRWVPQADTESDASARRRCLLVGACALWSALPAWAVQRDSLANPLRLGCDEALVNSGLASAWQRAFARDTGVVVSLIAEPATRILQMLDRAEVDMSLTNVPESEALLAKQGLAHDRTQVAVGGFVVVGPAALRKTLQPKPALLPPQALMSLLADSQTPFLTRGDDSGTHLFERALWNSLQITPAAPWYRSAESDTPVWLQAREANACTLVERGVWERAGRQSGLTAWSDTSLGWVVDVHVMRAFRVNHPAARLLTQWLSGPGGRRVATKQLGYRAPG